MLHLQKDALEANLRLQTLQIRKEEIEYYSSSLNAIAGCASMLSGFAYDGMVSGIDFYDIDVEHTEMYETVYFGLAGISFILSLAVMLMSLLSVTIAPSLALHGTSSGDVDRAVVGLRQQKNLVLLLFGVSMLFFAASVNVYALAKLETRTSILLTTLMSAFLVGMSWYLWRLKQLFHAAKTDTGRVDFLKSSRSGSERELVEGGSKEYSAGHSQHSSYTGRSRSKSE